MNKAKTICLTVSLCLESKAPKFVKVKAHVRQINGKLVKIRSHYRRVMGRTVRCDG